ncbi:Protein translation factor SUI1 [Neolecta irregularis DAH-3]|uniref:Protein translation factor SUI1 n=1 Tax=Neolecta irregularis (strain DAH-3) TaxID=1198029 RepID=A0A1U7LHG7_NEOID|nr:Protein translation factor SUI1 [Neolecta irregularis DAH-3]|eukprot:OLL22089.1 Protein translation factor SUI1 [Neolecta irregularis DAH-3]
MSEIIVPAKSGDLIRNSDSATEEKVKHASSATKKEEKKHKKSKDKEIAFEENDEDFGHIGAADFATALDEEIDDDDATKAQNYIHVRVQQRNGRKTLTTVQGLPSKYDPKRILKAIKKEFACNGNVVKDDEMGEVIQLQGDHRSKVFAFLQEQLDIPKKTIKIHGF